MDIDKSYEINIEELDKEIIRLFSIRINYKTNSNLYKHIELNNLKNYDGNISVLDYNIYLLEINTQKKNYKSYEKLFNPLININMNDKIKSMEDLNLNQIIKQIYIYNLYDICEYGIDDEDYIQNIITLDIQILQKLSERIHYGYEIIKYLYLNNKHFFEKFIFNNNNSEEIKTYIYDNLNLIPYLDKIQDLCNLYKINSTLICTFYKIYIIPFYLEIQLHFIYKLIYLN